MSSCIVIKSYTLAEPRRVDRQVTSLYYVILERVERSCTDKTTRPKFLATKGLCVPARAVKTSYRNRVTSIILCIDSTGTRICHRVIVWAVMGSPR